MVATSGNGISLINERADRSRKYRVLALSLLLLVGAGMVAALMSLTQDASAGSPGRMPGAPGATNSPNCGTDWAIVTSPNVGTHENILNGLAALSSDDVWAVGYSYTPPGTAQTLIEHWDGSLWSVIPSPNGGTNADNSLNGVAVVSTDDIWAVGSYGPESNTLTEHWNGTQWSVAFSPNIGTTKNILNGAAAYLDTSDFLVRATSMGSVHIDASANSSTKRYVTRIPNSHDRYFRQNSIHAFRSFLW